MKESSALERYGYNLTWLVQEEVFSALEGYEASLTRLFQILLQRENMRKKCNPLLLDSDGMSRWRVVTEAVRRMASGDVPYPLASRRVIVLDYEALFAVHPLSPGNREFARPRQALLDTAEWDALLQDASWEEIVKWLFSWPDLEDYEAPCEVLARLRELFLAIREKQGQVLLFVDHFHRLLGRESSRYSIDATRLLKPVLARREFQLIAACTPDQYRHFIEYDATISRRFQAWEIMPDEV